MISPSPTVKQHYADSAELERHWARWLESKAKGECDLEAWRLLQEGVYKICQGVATQFHPRDDDEHLELSHETFVLTIDKIFNGRLVFKPGKAPVFNLLTTTIFRHLYSLKNKQSRRHKLLLTKFLMQPGVISKITDGQPDIARSILTQKHEPFREANNKAPHHDIHRYILDPIDTFGEQDPEYRLFAISAKNKNKTLLLQFTRSRVKIKRNIEINGDVYNFLCELIEVLNNTPETYTFFKGVSSRGSRIPIQCRWVNKTIETTIYRFLYIMFIDAKVALMVEQSRIDGLILYISDFIDKLV